MALLIFLPYVSQKGPEPMSKDRILLLGGLRGVLLHTLHSLDRGETQALMKVSNLPKATQPSVCNRSSDVLIPKLGLFPKYREALREDSEWMRKRIKSYYGQPYPLEFMGIGPAFWPGTVNSPSPRKLAPCRACLKGIISPLCKKAFLF